MYGSVLVTKSIGSLTKGQAAPLMTAGTTNAGTSARHWCPTFPVSDPSNSQRKNNTSASSTQPLMLVNTSVLVTLSVQNMASSRAGAATDVSVNLNSRSIRYQAIRIATVLIRMNR